MVSLELVDQLEGVITYNITPDGDQSHTTPDHRSTKFMWHAACAEICEILLLVILAIIIARLSCKCK